MAKPRIFISSTYYDLKSVRADLEHFIRDQGFDPVLHERGSVVYTKEQSPEQGCYREIESCDILLSIVGGRYGSSASTGRYSISQMELKTAIEQNKQVYIFVERDVLSEHRTYLHNKEATIKWSSVDDVAIFRFIDEILALPNNNPIMSFETSHDIVGLIREQWAGLFQRLLQQASAEAQLAVARELRQGVDTVHRLVEILTASAGDAQKAAKDAIHAVLTPNHPIFRRVRSVMKSPYRLFFTNLDELNAWLKTRGFTPVEQEAWDDDKYREWINNRREEGTLDLLKISISLFDGEGRLITEGAPWKDDLVKREIRASTPSPDSDDVPF